MKPKHLIYIVDDELFNLFLISRKLKQQFNCKTELFRSVPDVIEAIDKKKPDLILSDCRFAKDNEDRLGGDYLVKWMKTSKLDTPVIMYSSYSNIEFAINIMRKGAHDFVVRDENFLDKVITRVNFQLRSLRFKSQRRIGKGKIILSIAIISGVLLYFSAYHPTQLVRVSLLMLVLCATLLFLKDPIQKISGL